MAGELDDRWLGWRLPEGKVGQAGGKSGHHFAGASWPI